MAQEMTAVEWLSNNFPKVGKYITLEMTFEIHAKFQEAERMHQQQIKDAFYKGRTQGIKGMSNAHYTSLITAEEYYQQTFKK